MSKELFEVAARKKYRFETPRGLLTAEDLWDLPLSGKASTANLDDVARSLFHKTKDSDTIVSFVTQTTSTNPDTINALELVKYIICVKLEERKVASETKERADKKQKILEVIARKKDGALEAASLEELEAMAETL